MFVALSPSIVLAPTIFDVVVGLRCTMVWEVAEVAWSVAICSHDEVFGALLQKDMQTQTNNQVWGVGQI